MGLKYEPASEPQCFWNWSCFFNLDCSIRILTPAIAECVVDVVIPSAVVTVNPTSPQGSK